MQLRMLGDNVLVQLDLSSKEEKRSAGGIIMPSADSTRDATSDGIFATIIAIGPGVHASKWLGHEYGTAPIDRLTFLATDPALVPGARVVLAKAALAGDRVKAQDKEYRIIKTHCIEAVIENE
jgi:co-chaperonin GroES (HSP10)